jgi:hypothetical protein
MYFGDLSGLWIVFVILAAAFVSVLLIGLKLFGFLLLSWWWVMSPIPIVIVLAIFCAGLVSLFD